MIVCMITIPETWIQGINIAILVLYVIFLIRGAMKGVLLQILTTFGTFGAFLGAWRYCSLAQAYMNLWPLEWNPLTGNAMFGKAAYVYLNEMAWFFLLFIIIRLVFLVIEKLAEGLSSLPVVKEISGLLGGVLGVITATVWMLLFSTLLHTPLFENGAAIFEKTLLKPISAGVSYISEAVDAPLNASEVFSRVYTDYKNLDGKDKEFLQQWLSDHGFEPIPEVPEGSENLPEGINIEDLPEGFSMEDIPEGYSIEDLPEGMTLEDIYALMGKEKR